VRIIFHSNAPWTTSAYGQQTALFAPLIRDLGHEVIISAFHGLTGGAVTWQDMLVLPGCTPSDVYGAALLKEHVRETAADLVITLSDIWVMEPGELRNIPVAHWMPVDCMPLSSMDMMCLQVSGARPVAMSEFGQLELAQAGYTPLYVPHGIHPAFLGDLPSREEARARLGLGGEFVIGMNAANKDAFRKGSGEQFWAFAKFHAKHPDSVLLVHGADHDKGAIDLRALAKSLAITDAVRFPDPYLYRTGQIGVSDMAAWYAALDLYSGCSWAEGFGIPVVEAQACGVPVVVTDGSAMGELCGAGWLVGAEPVWNPMHNAWWRKPLTDGIYKVYEVAYLRGKAYHARRAKAREFAQRYEAGLVAQQYWKPALEALEAVL
jgi:glycosyltransferase involved in cell wall biosynthesis